MRSVALGSFTIPPHTFCAGTTSSQGKRYAELKTPKCTSPLSTAISPSTTAASAARRLLMQEKSSRSNFPWVHDLQSVLSHQTVIFGLSTVIGTATRNTISPSYKSTTTQPPKPGSSSLPARCHRCARRTHGSLSLCLILTVGATPTCRMRKASRCTHICASHNRFITTKEVTMGHGTALGVATVILQQHSHSSFRRKHTSEEWTVSTCTSTALSTVGSIILWSWGNS
jgi:hypothetical protein